MDILLGDDHPLFREGIQRLLQNTYDGMSVAHCGSFDELVEAVDGDCPADLIMTDLQMPGWPGFQGITQLTRMRPGTPVVVVSASQDTADMRAAIEHGASGFIPKASSVAVMIGALDLVLAGGIYIPAQAMTAGNRTAANRPAAVEERMQARSAATARSGFDGLTHRQIDVLNCLREGKSNKQIAYELGLSEGTVKIHVTAIFKQLGVKNRTQAVISAARLASAE